MVRADHHIVYGGGEWKHVCCLVRADHDIAYANGLHAVTVAADLILWDVSSGGNGNLNQQHLVPPLWVLLQELFKSQELLRNAFDHVKPIDA